MSTLVLFIFNFMSILFTIMSNFIHKKVSDSNMVELLKRVLYSTPRGLNPMRKRCKPHIEEKEVRVRRVCVYTRMYVYVRVK